MDTPTQALLGAAVGQAVFGKRLGPRAAWLGALGGALPDIDVFTRLMADPMASWLYHRGLTHSLFFAPLAGLALGLGWHALEKRRASRGRVASEGELALGSPKRQWALVGLFTLAVLSHPLLDWPTVYGTQLLAPFTDTRFALNAVAVLDPTYSVILATALIVGAIWRRRRNVAVGAATVALVLSTGYIGAGLALNERTEARVSRHLAELNEGDPEVTSYPVLFQIFLRRVIVRADDDLRIGYVSTLDGDPENIHWTRHEVHDDPRVDRLLASREGRIFTWFSMGQYVPRVIEGSTGATVELADVRYGVPLAEAPGLWGLDAHFDREGRMTETPAPYRRQVDWENNGIDDIFRAIFDGPRRTFARRGVGGALPAGS